MAAPNRPTVLAAYGDLILVVGPDRRRFKLESQELIKASDVFAAMFRPEFDEGRRLREANGEPIEVDLPDDEPFAIEKLCRLLYGHVIFGVNEPVTVLLLAVTAHKYNMVGVVYLSLLVDGPISTCAKPRELWDLLVASYLVKDSLAFKKVSGRLIAKYPGPFIDLPDEPGQPLTPLLGGNVPEVPPMRSDLIPALEDCRRRARLELLRGITSAQCGMFSTHGRTLAQNEDLFYSKIKDLYNDPTQFKKTELENMSIENLVQAIADAQKGTEESDDSFPRMDNLGPRKRRAQVASQMKAAADYAEGLCLDCFEKHGRKAAWQLYCEEDMQRCSEEE